MSKDKLHFDDPSKQVVCLFFVAVFSKRNRKLILFVSNKLYIETLMKIWENSKIL